MKSSTSRSEDPIVVTKGRSAEITRAPSGFTMAMPLPSSSENGAAITCSAPCAIHAPWTSFSRRSRDHTTLRPESSETSSPPVSLTLPARRTHSPSRTSAAALRGVASHRERARVEGRIMRSIRTVVPKVTSEAM
jgi:hypothetical protein